MKRYLIVFIFMSIFVSAANAEIYKWVDEDGVTQYTHKPPSKDKQQYKSIGDKSGKQVDNTPKVKRLCGEIEPGHYAGKKAATQQQYQKRIKQCSDTTGPLKLSDAQKQRCIDNKMQELKDALIVLEREKAENCRDEMLRRVTADNNPGDTKPGVKEGAPKKETNIEADDNNSNTDADEAVDEMPGIPVNPSEN